MGEIATALICLVSASIGGTVGFLVGYCVGREQT